jgi:prophage antirepressor-like protein
MKPAEITFPDSKKDRICQIDSTRHITVAVTSEKNLVYFVGDKFAKLIGVDNSTKFGFVEMPVDKSDLFVKPDQEAVESEKEDDPVETKEQPKNAEEVKKAVDSKAVSPKQEKAKEPVIQGEL